jgi:hypothetical protein
VVVRRGNLVYIYIRDGHWNLFDLQALTAAAPIRGWFIP